MDEEIPIQITREMKRQFNRATLIRSAVCTIVYFSPLLLIFFSTPGVNLDVSFGFVALVCLITFVYGVAALLVHFKLIAPRIWRHTIELTEDQFKYFGGKVYCDPPERFADIFKYNGELDFDYTINTYNGIRLPTLSTKPPYIARFRREEDATLFKLSLP